MKRITAVIFLSISFFACSKEKSLEGGGTPVTGGGTGGGGSTSNYYIKAKIDGVAKTYTNVPMATTIATGGSSVVNFTAGSGGISLEGISLAINLVSGTISMGTTYSENAITTAYIVGGVYNPNSFTVIYAAGLAPISIDPLKITITSKTATEVAGTFKGAFYKQDLSNPTAISTEFKRVTEGEFKLPIR